MPFHFVFQAILDWNRKKLEKVFALNKKKYQIDSF